MTLKSGLEVTNVTESGTIQQLRFGFLFAFCIVTMAVSVAVCDIFSVKEWPDLETGSGFVQGHWK